MSEIKILTLITGPAIIAKIKTVERDKESYYVLEDPLNIVYTKNEENSPKFMVHNMLVLSNDTVIEIMVKNVLFSYTPLPEIIEQYNTMLLNKLTPIDD